jgi:mannose PTS system EIIA component
MIGIVLVAHGSLAQEFATVVQQITGAQQALATIGIGPEDNMESKRQEISAQIAAVDAGHGVIVLTDMFGGTPSNLAISLLEKTNIEVIAGFNLPMLIKLCGVRKTHSLQTAVKETQDAGKRYIHVASQILGGE